MGWVFPIVLWLISALILIPKNFQNVNNYIFGIWIKEIKYVNAINVYHICPRWFLIVGCLTSIWLGKFLETFHSTGCSYPLVHLLIIPRCEHVEHKQINGHFILPTMAYPESPLQVLVWKRGLGGVLDMNGMGFWNPSHDWRK